MTTATDIANHALSAVLGEGTISNISDPEKAAELCALHFETALDFVINEGKFPGTVTRATLTPFGAPSGGWTYSYQLPSLIVAPIGLASGYDWAAPEGTLLTDDPAPDLIYKKRPTNYGGLANSMKAAVGCKLAFLIAFDLTNDQNKVVLADNEYGKAISIALRDAAVGIASAPKKRPRWGAARTY